MTVQGVRTAALLLAAGLLALPDPAAGQRVTSDASQRVFFGGKLRSGIQPADRWGVPRLNAHRDRRPSVNAGTIGSGDRFLDGRKDRGKRGHQRRRLPRRRFDAAIPFTVMNQVVQVNVGEAEAPAPRKAVRNVDRLPEPDFARRDEPATEPAVRGAERSEATGAAAEAGRDRSDVTYLPLVPPISSAGGEDAPVDPRDCVSVAIRTRDGIQWSRRVTLDQLGVSSVIEAAQRLRATIGRGRPLRLGSADGEFTVPANLVESLVVGPCR